jgi:hypothetical protein
MVSQAASGGNVGANQSASAASISQDGSSIVFFSDASDLTVGDYNNFRDAFAYITPPPKVTSVQINDGKSQRSVVKSLTITFDQPVFFSGNPAAAFTLTRNDQPGTPVGLAANVTTGVVTTVTLTFSGSLTAGGSLTDGNYTLSIDATQVKNIAALDGNGDGTAGDAFVTAPGTIFRLYGDSNGDRRVDNYDFLAFRMAMFGGVGASYFDNDGDGVDLVDFIAFRGRLGMVI